MQFSSSGTHLHPAKNLSNGWEIRRRNFGNTIWFFAPSLKTYDTSELSQSCDCTFQAFSITGEKCALNCDHCRAGILHYMQPALEPEDLLAAAGNLHARGAKGILISGGSDSRGIVPLAPFLGTLARIREKLGLRVIVHTGITDIGLARGLADAGVDSALIDIIGARETIGEICHLGNLGTDDYERSLANLVDAGVPVSPHVVIGLHRGAIKGEYKALEIIHRYDIASLVLVGITPKPDTPMAAVEPPSPGEMGEIFLRARRLLPRVPILLGCERPGGEHKEATDKRALQAGLNGIAYPAEGIISHARQLGLETVTSEMCCALVFDRYHLAARGINSTGTENTKGSGRH